ncbi:MAG: histidinol-phosphate transaminase [Marinifilaceae bacterium]
MNIHTPKHQKLSMIHGHGDDSYLYKHPIVANFSTNVWYGGKSKQLKEHIFNIWDKIHSYPEVAAESLTLKIAENLGVTRKQVLATNGATEAFYLIAQCFRGKESTIVIPTFAEYEDACRINKHQLNFIKWAELEENPPFPKGLAWICNPNNPDGSVLERDKLISFLTNNPETLFVVDEAYIDFTDSISSSIDLINKFTNLILVKSLTKNFAIPGLRLGYLVANKQLVQDIQFYKAPWSVNSIAIEAGKFIFDHFQDFKPPIKYYKSESEKFASKINDISGFRIIPSKTSYFLVKLEKGSSFELKKYLIDQFGLLIRDASNFRGLNSSYIRLATQSEENNLLMIKALKEWSNLNS